MIDAGLLVSVHSDDPAYFAGYVGDNYRGLHDYLGFDDDGLADLARNSINSSFLDPEEKDALLLELDEMVTHSTS